MSDQAPMTARQEVEHRLRSMRTGEYRAFREGFGGFAHKADPSHIRKNQTDREWKEKDVERLLDECHQNQALWRTLLRKLNIPTDEDVLVQPELENQAS